MCWRALGSTQTLVALGLCAGVIFFAAGRRRDLALFAVTMAGASVLNVTLKLSFGRARPTTFFDTPLPASYSFPSGHALLSLCFYGALAVAVASRLRRPEARAAVWAAAGLLASLIGFSRILPRRALPKRCGRRLRGGTRLGHVGGARGQIAPRS